MDATTAQGKSFQAARNIVSGSFAAMRGFLTNQRSSTNFLRGLPQRKAVEALQSSRRCSLDLGHRVEESSSGRIETRPCGALPCCEQRLADSRPPECSQITHFGGPPSIFRNPRAA